MAIDGLRVTTIGDIPPLEDPDLGDLEADWRPVRHHLGVDAFGTNAYVAREAGQVVIEDHVEADDAGEGHRELYFVHRGESEFTVDGETFSAPAGTLVYLEDPTLRRRAVAREPGTTILAVGAQAGVAFEPSDWELRRTADIPRVT
jgi:hypothetical protein